MNDQLTSQDDLTIEIVESGVVTFEDLVRCVQRFHYGRNANRSDFSLVWRERKGSCSSKHAFLKMMANLNKLPYIDLILCIYRMSEKNTPGVGAILKKNQLTYIPEAHCFLRMNGVERDLTFTNSSIQKLEEDILLREIIKPEDVVERKIQIHQAFINQWIVKENSQHSFDEIWEIREQCISALEKNRD